MAPSPSPTDRLLRLLEKQAKEADEARLDRARTVEEERRPSITVAPDGCIVQRGFVIPGASRRSSPSPHSRNASTTSLRSTSSARSESPLRAALRPPLALDFPRPTGSTINAPELSALLKEHPDSFHRPLRPQRPQQPHRPTKSASDLDKLASRLSRSSLSGRWQSWQPTGPSSSTWSVDELAEVTCKSPPKADITDTDHVTSALPSNLKRTSNLHRTKTAQVNLQALGQKQEEKHRKKIWNERKDREKSDDSEHHRQGGRSDHPPTPLRPMGPVESKQEDVQIVSQGEAEDAIASDSEDDFIDDAVTNHNVHLAMQRRHGQCTSYAERRALNDAKAEEEFNRSIEAHNAGSQQGVEEALPDIKIVQVHHINRDQESAIDTDGEDEDDGVAAALRVAQFHRTQLEAASSQGAADFAAKEPLCEQTRKDSRTDEQAAEKGHTTRHRRKSSLSVKVDPESVAKLAVAEADEKDGVTPREIKSFEKDSPIRCRKLRPSRSRPRPTKSALKKSRSPSPSEPSSNSSGDSPSKKVGTRTVRRTSTLSKCKDTVLHPFQPALVKFAIAGKTA